MPGTNESFLHRVLRQRRLPEDQASDGVKPITGGHREDFESLVVSASGCLYEISPHSLSITGAASFSRAISYDGRGKAIYSNTEGNSRIVDCRERKAVAVRNDGPLAPGALG